MLLVNKMDKKYYKFELDMVKTNIVALLLLIPYITVGIIFKEFFGTLFGVDNFLVFFILMIIYFIIHELCHGLGYSLFAKDKKNIKYGIALEKGVIYAMCQENISKKGAIVSLIMPLLLLTIIAIPIGIILNFSILVELALINLMGAAGDILMLNLIRKLPSDAEYIDYNTDIGAFFLSEKDLTDIKSIAMKCTKSGIHKETLIDKSYKKLNVTKTSKIIIIIIVGVFLLDMVLDLIN